jgi:hypothetical protein
MLILLARTIEFVHTDQVSALFMLGLRQVLLYQDYIVSDVMISEKGIGKNVEGRRCVI